MNNIKLLDCTLRDGGYVNDWNFGHDNIVSLFERLVSTNVDMIEVGFLDERQKFNIDRTIMPDTDCVGKIFGGLDRRQAMVVGMIDFGTCGIENLSPCKDSYLDGIRVIFKKHLMHEAIAFCRQVKDLGYQVFTQAVSITSYSDREMLDLIDLVNELKPYAVSIVDTYGLLHQEHLMHYFELLDHNLVPEIGVGYHSHNNFQLAYSNCMEVLKAHTDRMVVVDATLYGMGKSAGNAPIELLSMYLNTNCGKNYDISQMLEAIDINIMNIYEKSPWGYNLFFYLSASNNCHPSYVKYLMDKHTLSLKSLNEILNSIEFEKKLLYDQKYIEHLYNQYQNAECNDVSDLAKLEEQLAGKKILLVGPGKNVQAQEEKIKAYIDENHPVVISTNYIPGALMVDYVFLSNSRRYVQLNSVITEYKNRDTKVIATSNVTNTKGSFDYTLNYSSLVDEDAEVIDNAFIMLLKTLMKVKVKNVACAGFDGYSPIEDNYYNSSMEYRIEKEKSNSMNQYVVDCLKKMEDKISVKFITDTFYVK